MDEPEEPEPELFLMSFAAGDCGAARRWMNHRRLRRRSHPGTGRRQKARWFNRLGAAMEPAISARDRPNQ